MQPSAQDRTINHRGRPPGEAREPWGRGKQLAVLPPSSAGKPRPDPRPLETSTRARVASCPPQCPPGVSGAAGLPWAPGGPPRHGGCAPRLSGGRGRSHGLSSHAALGPGLIPPHTAPRGQPRRPSPSFPAVQAPTLHTGRLPRSPQGRGPRTMTRTRVSLNTGP